MTTTKRRKIRIVSRPKPRRPFWDGIARIFDFTGSLNTPERTLPRDLAVKYALWRSWKTVGDNMWSSVGNYEPDGKPHAKSD